MLKWPFGREREKERESLSIWINLFPLFILFFMPEISGEMEKLERYQFGTEIL